MTRLLPVLTLFAGCTTVEITEYEQCDLQVSVAVAEVAPGDTLRIEGRPFSADYDTSVRIGSQAADVLDVDRSDCAVCDECRASADCGYCKTCSECDAVCETCSETIDVTVPDLAPGPAQLVLINAFGASDPIDLTITEAPDDTAADSGS